MITASRIAWASIAGALAFFFLQMMILEIREASQERSGLRERIAAVEAKTAALASRVEALAGFVATQRPLSPATPPPPEL